jgi:predicted glycosyltransferase
LARRVIVPSVFPDDALRQFDARPKKVVRYQGFKEELYLADFRADATVLEQLALDPRKVIAVFRPPPEGALYHRMANERFGELLRLAVGREDVQVSCFPVRLSSADVTPRPATG